MPVMAVNNENPHEQAGDYRSRPRWSAGKKTDAVLRLLRGEPLEALSRELGVEAHRLAAWRDDFLEGGKEALKGQRPDRSPDDRPLKQAERKVGQLTMENEVLRAAAERGGCRSRRRSGPGSHGAPAAGGGGVLGARRAPLQRCRRVLRRSCAWTPARLRRASTGEQPHFQVDALDRAGRYRLFTDPAGCPATDRHTLK
jgi:transposase